MFKWLFKHRNKSETVAPESAISRKSAIRNELAMRASITKKLRRYNADEDTTISKFTLADEKVEGEHGMKLTQVKTRDAWDQANPGETGKWKKENQQER